MRVLLLRCSTCGRQLWIEERPNACMPEHAHELSLVGVFERADEHRVARALEVRADTRAHRGLLPG